MIIKVINNNTLILDDFKFKCCVGKYGITKNKQEGDKKTPKGNFKLGNLYFRKDRHPKPDTKLKVIPIKKDMGWCDDVKSINYNKLIKISKKINHEKLTRKDSNYDFLIPINYNVNKVKKNKGSAIFIHITENYKKTLGCVAIKKKDMLILLKLVKKNSTIKII